MKAVQFFAVLIMGTAIFVAVFGAFFDVITPNEAVMVLAAFGVPLTLLGKLLA